MKQALVFLAFLALGCQQSAQDCWQDSGGLVWTDKSLMWSYADKQGEINGSNLCYPGVGLTRKQIDRGKPCPHPKQKIVNGWCECVPRPDVLFTRHEIAQWCKHPPGRSW